MFSSIRIKKCLFRAFTLSLSFTLTASCTHAHTHAHTHACLQRQRLSLCKLCQNSVLPQINHFLPKEANTCATWLQWVAGLCILKYPVCQLFRTVVRRASLIAEQSGELPTLDHQHQGPFLKVTPETSSGMV